MGSTQPPNTPPLTLESDTRQTHAGISCQYDLLLPLRLAPEPFPLVIVLHDHSRSPAEHRGTAEHLARLGLAVLAPTIIARVDRASHVINAAAVVDHCRWLRARTETPGDLLYTRIDASSVVIIGHGTGGSIACEASVELQASARCGASFAPVLKGLLLLGVDKVPGEMRLERLERPQAFLSLGVMPEQPETGTETAGAPPLCYGQVTGLGKTEAACRQRNVTAPQRLLGFASVQVLLRGATHSDMECPSALHCSRASVWNQAFPHLDRQDWGASVPSGPAGSADSLKQQLLVQGLIVACVADAFDLWSKPSSANAAVQMQTHTSLDGGGAILGPGTAAVPTLQRVLQHYGDQGLLELVAVAAAGGGSDVGGGTKHDVRGEAGGAAASVVVADAEVAKMMRQQRSTGVADGVEPEWQKLNSPVRDLRTGRLVLCTPVEPIEPEGPSLSDAGASLRSELAWSK